MEFAPDGRLFILERTGAVKIYKNGSLLSEPFVTLPAASNGDRGLIGVTFDPEFETNRYVYFYYAGSDNYNYLVRFDASGDVATEPATILFQTTTPSERLHVGGSIDFGPDGKLYLAIGDNGYPPNSQNINNPFGKILRLNKNGTVPEDNPFYYDNDAQKEIWAYGFRNPWRFSFDSQTGQLIVGDVGEDTWEELNIVEGGKNYGWPTAEGVCNCGFQDPFHAYLHTGPSSAVTAGPIYRNTMFPENYQGDLFFGDYGQGFIRTYDFESNTESDFDTEAGPVVDIKIGQDGSLYVLTIFPGEIVRYSYSEGNHPPAVFINADTLQGALPLAVNFNSGGTFDPEGDPLTYLWDFGDGTTSSLANPTKIYTTRGSYTAKVTVSDGVSEVISQSITIQAGTPPVLTFISPDEGFTYRAEDIISYEASAVDEFGQVIPDENFITEILHHRGSHIHPHEGPLTGVNSGEFYIPAIGKADPDQWYEIKITAIDNDGLSTTNSRLVYPELSSYTVDSTIPNSTILIDGSPWLTPKEVSGLIGFEQELSVNFIQDISGTLYRFSSWEHGGERTQTISMPQVPETFLVNLTPTTPYVAEYFDNINLEGDPILTQDEININYLWEYGPPEDLLPQDNFSVRWSKTENFVGGEYEFSLTTDDGMRVFLDGNIIYDAWFDQSPTNHIFTTSITPGEHTLVVEYYENEWEARAAFEYRKTGETPPPPDDFYTLEMWNWEGQSPPTFPTTDPIISSAVNEINEDWGQNAPYPELSEDKFMARWTKQIDFESGIYVFETVSDDGVRVMIDGETIINEWNDHGATLHTSEQLLAAGNHTVVVEYYENGWDAVANFNFNKKTDSLPIPADIYRAEYWNVSGFGIPAREADYIEEVEVVNFDWGQGSPAPGIGVDKFVVRFSSIQTFENGVYKIQTTTDDGVRVYIDGELVIDNWTDHGSTIDEFTYTLNGEHEVVMEYYENGWDAVCVLDFLLQ